MLMTHVAPLFQSPHGHLRAKAAWVSGVYADIKFASGYGGGAHYQALFRAIVAALADTELPVRDEYLSGNHSVLQKTHFQALLRAVVAALAAALLVRRHVMNAAALACRESWQRTPTSTRTEGSAKHLQCLALHYNSHLLLIAGAGGCGHGDARLHRLVQRRVRGRDQGPHTRAAGPDLQAHGGGRPCWVSHNHCCC